MDRVFAEMEFLARSANRGDVLTLVAGAPHDREALAEATGASQPTLGRILRDFEERDWVRATERGYTATATGRLDDYDPNPDPAERADQSGHRVDRGGIPGADLLACVQ